MVPSTGFKRLGDESLQRIAPERQAEPGHVGQHGGMTGHSDTELFRADGPARGLYAAHRAGRRVAVDAGDGAILDDIDAQPVGGAGIAPHDRVVAHGSGATLHHAGKDRDSAHRLRSSEAGRSRALLLP